MRRQLMKKLKKGYLTPGEREDLMQLDREVNRANRQAAGMTGAGLGSALLIASKMGAGDALGDWLDTRQNKKELEAEKEPMEEKTADQIAQENANTLVEQAREEMKDESAEAPDSLDIEEIDEKEEDFKEDWGKRQRDYDKLERQRGVESGRRIVFDVEYPAGPPVREQVGPRVEEQAQGGYTPFLRAMRDRMRKKYGSR